MPNDAPIPISKGQRFSVARWIQAVQRHPGRPAPNQRDVLTALAVEFIDWKTGEGIASLEMLSDFTRTSRQTVQRSLKWAMDAGLLVRTKRGHCLPDGKPMASEWLLTWPGTCQEMTVPKGHGTCQEKTVA